MIYKPVGNCIWLTADKAPEKSKGGIILQETWKSLPPVGTIIDVGPEVKNKYLKKGVRVLFNRYAAVMLEDEQRIITEADILAIVEEEDVKTD